MSHVTVGRTYYEWGDFRLDMGVLFVSRIL